MADDLKHSPDTLTPTVRREQALARVQAVPWFIVIALIALSAWLGYKAFFDRAEGDPVGSAMLAFQKQNSLTVFSSRFEIVATSEDNRGVLNIDLLRSRQAAVIPAMVEYRIDMAQVDRDRFQWDDGADTLTVTLPPLRVSRPNLDEGSARYFTEGTFVTRDASRDLSRNNTVQAERKAIEFARNPEIIALARNAARQAVRQNLAIPLESAGFGDVRVEVRFDGENAASPAGQ